MGTLVVFIALALRMTEKQRTHTERERLNRKEMQGEAHPKSTFPPRKVTIPAAGMPDDGHPSTGVYPSSLSGEARFSANRRSPGNRETLEDHTLATHPVGQHRSSAPGSVAGEREPLLTA